MKKLLSVKDLHVTFFADKKALHAVRGIDFSLQEGEIVGIVGESGCGKSAALKALTQLHARHSTHIRGHIAYGEKELLTYSERQMRSIRGKEMGMIFQDPMSSLNPTMHIGAQIQEGFVQHFPHVSSKRAREVVLERLHEVGLPSPQELFHLYPHMLSGGMRQRVMIALALACEPRILLADEPTTALDVTIQAQILQLLRAIRLKKKTSILIITHDMGVVANLCDRVLVMYAGKIVEAASTENLFLSPQHPYTQKLISAITTLDQPKDKRLLSIEGRPPVLCSKFTGCGFCSRCDEVMPRCHKEAPPLQALSPVHECACFKRGAGGDS